MSDGSGESPRRRAILAALPFVLAATAVVAWVASWRPVVVAALAAGILCQIAVVVRRGGQRTLRLQAVGGTMLTGLLVAVLAGPRAGALLMPAGVACVLVALGLLQNAAVRARAARALRSRGVPEDEPETAWSRDRASLTLALPTLVFAILLVPVATWTFPLRGETADDSTSEPPPQSPSNAFGSRPSGAPPGAHGAQKDGGEPSGRAPGFSPLGGGAPDPFLARRVLLEVAPTHDGKSTGKLGPMYLRGVPFTNAAGRWIEDFAKAMPIRDADDGRADGWCDLAPRPNAGDEMDVAVHQEVLEFAASGETVVLCPPGTASVHLPDIRAAADGPVLTQRSPAAGVFDCQLVARLPSRVPFPVGATRVARAAARAPNHAAPPGLTDAAKTAAASATNDLDRVRAVMNHLRDHFTYDEVNAPRDDAAALAAFATARHGTCVQFAQAGVVMLQSLGIPARVGTGFLVSDWDEERNVYVGHARDSHAWVEVPFEGCGWVIFDPTPVAPSDADSGRPGPDDTPGGSGAGAGAWGDEDWNPFEAIVSAVRDAFDALWNWIAGNTWLCAAAAVAASVLVVSLLRGRSRRLSGEAPAVPSQRGPWDRLVSDLARRGWRRPASQTATEFAASVAASGGDAYAAFPALTARQQAARFGDRPLAPEDEAAIEAFRVSLGK